MVIDGRQALHAHIHTGSAKIDHGRPAGYPPVVVGLDGIDLRLLQHYFADKDLIGTLRALSGGPEWIKIYAPGHASLRLDRIVPGEKSLAEAIRQHVI